jgi:hypothetical protein
MKKSTADRDEKRINERINELAHEYDTLPRRDPRRAEIANEISELRLRLHQLKKQPNTKSLHAGATNPSADKLFLDPTVLLRLIQK